MAAAPDTIKQRLCILDAEVRRSASGGYMWVTVERAIHGRHVSHSVSCPEIPTEADLQLVRDQIDEWRKDALDHYGG